MQKCDKNSHVQNYECQIIRNGIAFDKCLEEELNFLWRKGIRTVGCCCGTHVDSRENSSYIQVIFEDIPKMLQLGYIQIRPCIFSPKTVIEKNDYIKFLHKALGVPIKLLKNKGGKIKVKLRTLNELKNGKYQGDCDKTWSYQIGITLLWMFPFIFFGCILKTTIIFDSAMLLYYAAKTLSAFLIYIIVSTPIVLYFTLCESYIGEKDVD